MAVALKLAAYDRYIFSTVVAQDNVADMDPFQYTTTNVCMCVYKVLNQGQKSNNNGCKWYSRVMSSKDSEWYELDDANDKKKKKKNQLRLWLGNNDKVGDGVEMENCSINFIADAQIFFFFSFASFYFVLMHKFVWRTFSFLLTRAIVVLCPSTTITAATISVKHQVV